MSVGPWQIAIIALVVLLLFGAGRLGDIGKGLGEGIRNFKKGINEDLDDEDEASDESKAEKPKELKQSESSTADDDSEPAAKKEA